MFYRRKGYSVTVLNFNTKTDYEKDGIEVISLHKYEEIKSKTEFDIAVCHAANIKYHYRFLKKNDILFKHIVFFYHGHEVMKLKDYPNDYSYIRNNRFVSLLTPIYDRVKLSLWKHYITRNIDKIELVFVSEWMRDTFMTNIHLDDSVLKRKNLHVIYNCISKRFEESSWIKDCAKEYDFITIRGCIDTSKFAIDFLNQLAFSNPEASFLLVGKGEYFNHNKKAPNLIRIEKYMNQNEICDILNKSRCALMPTRLDAQGVMTCEMASFGIPVITSDIPVCRYVLDGFSNVRYIENANANVNLLQILSEISLPEKKNNRFFEAETVQKELDLYELICKQK
jgi:glycosyltransferase involved in cell wall biosynthesis